MLLEVNDLVVHYNKVLALKGISLEVPEDSIVALIGANGAGKTTFLRTVSGLESQSSGQILFQDKPIGDIPPHLRVKMGIAHVPEGRRIFPRLSVKENLLTGSHCRENKTQIKSDLEHIYQQFPILQSRKSQLGGSLSGGEQQMLAIARALMSDPRLLLLDEPSLGLSPIATKDVFKIIQQVMKTRKIGIIIVEQNARMALSISSLGYVIENGSVSIKGPSSELLIEDHVRRAFLGVDAKKNNILNDRRQNILYLKTNHQLRQRNKEEYHMAQEILDSLKKAIFDYDRDAASALTKEALATGVPPLDILDALVEAVKVVGDGFGSGDLFLPDLVGAAAALEAATPHVEEALKSSGKKREVLGTVVLGTVEGDIHTIGKSMVASLLVAEGFEVIDLGIDIKAEKFVEAVQANQANLLGMSALLSTTAPQCKVVIDMLTEAGVRSNVKVMVGGGAMTANFATAIGADGYESTAPRAVQLARNLLNA